MATAANIAVTPELALKCVAVFTHEATLHSKYEVTLKDGTKRTYGWHDIVLDITRSPKQSSQRDEHELHDAPAQALAIDPRPTVFARPGS